MFFQQFIYQFQGENHQILSTFAFQGSNRQRTIFGMGTSLSAPFVVLAVNVGLATMLVLGDGLCPSMCLALVLNSKRIVFPKNNSKIPPLFFSNLLLKISSHNSILKDLSEVYVDQRSTQTCGLGNKAFLEEIQKIQISPLIETKIMNSFRVNLCLRHHYLALLCWFRLQNNL